MNIFIIFLKIYFLKNYLRGSVILFWKIFFLGNVPFGQMYILASVNSGK